MTEPVPVVVLTHQAIANHVHTADQLIINQVQVRDLMEVLLVHQHLEDIVHHPVQVVAQAVGGQLHPVRVVQAVRGQLQPEVIVEVAVPLEVVQAIAEAQVPDLPVAHLIREVAVLHQEVRVQVVRLVQAQEVVHHLEVPVEEDNCNIHIINLF